MKTEEYYMKLKYPILLSEIVDDGETVFVAEIRELPGLRVYGDSVQEVLSDIEDAKSIWFETNIALKRYIKEPIQSDEEVSGRVTLRMGKTLHQKVKKLAADDDLSINSKLNELILLGIENETMSHLKNCMDDNHTEVLRRLNRYDYEYEAVINGSGYEDERGGSWKKKTEDLNFLGRILHQ